MDYEQLLKKYMRHVGEEEGVFFTDFYLDGKEFTPEEVEVLNQMGDELSEELKNGIK